MSVYLHHFLKEKALIALLSTSFGVRAFIAMGHSFGLVVWPSTVFGPSLFTDFSTILAQLHYVSLGYIPYRDFGFSLGPLFLYLLYPFYMLSQQLAALPIVVSDALTGPLLFALLRERVGARTAFIAGAAYTISPFILLNESYLIMDGQPLTLFLVLAIGYYLKGRPLPSVVFLSVALLLRQETAFVLPIFIFGFAKLYGKSALKYFGVAGAILGGVSAPFLILAPRAFLYSILYGLSPYLGPRVPFSLPVGGSAAGATTGAVQSCTQTTFPGIYTGAVCGTIVNLQQLAQFLAAARVWAFLDFIQPFIFATLVFSLLAARKSENLFSLASVYAMLGGFLAFSIFVHPLFAYYFVPVYAMILLSCNSKVSVSVASIGLILVSIVPEGSIQFIWPLLLVFIVTAVDSSEQKKTHFPNQSSFKANHEDVK